MKPKLIAIIFLAACCAPVFGEGIFVLHSGAVDPTTEGFRLVEEQPASVGPVFNDLGLNAWQTYCDERTNAFSKAYYQQLFTVQQNAEINASDWTLTVTARGVGTAGGDNAVNIYTGSQFFQLGFQTIFTDEVVDMEGSTQQSLDLKGGGSAYHTYQIEYHQSTGSADLYIDGTETLTGITGETIPNGGYGGVTWGELYGGEANWNLVSLDVIPEPSISALCLIGGGITCWHRRRQRVT